MAKIPSITPSNKGILARIAKLLFRIFLGLVVLIILVIIGIHIPAVQKKITVEIAEYLSNKTGGDISIEQIRFSILGNVRINGLEVFDPTDSNVMSADQLSAEISVSDMLTGNLVFEGLEIRGFEGQLIERGEGLNIQFIIDAFQTQQIVKDPSSDNLKETVLQFDKIALKDIHFRYLSLINDVDFQTNLEFLNIEEAYLNINPNKIVIRQLFLENAYSSLITAKDDTQTSQATVEVKSRQLPGLDLNSGFDIDIQDFEIKNNSFSFHESEILEEKKFDPNHIDATDIQVKLTDLLISADSLSAQIKQMTAELPGFPLREFKADIQIGQQQLDLTDLSVTTKGSNVMVSVGATYNHFPNLIDELDKAALQLSLAGNIDQADLVYFFGDSVTKHIRNWQVLNMKTETKYSAGNAYIEQLDFGVGSSNLVLKGVLTNLGFDDNIGWQNLSINTSVGKEFKEALSSYTTGFNLPPIIQFNGISSGRLNAFDLEGHVITSWGKIRSKGSAGLRNSDISIKMTLIGDEVRLGDIFDLPWLGSTDFSLKTEGKINDNLEIDIDGSVNKIELFEHVILNTKIKSQTLNKTTSSSLVVEDPDYRSKIDTEISYAGPLIISGNYEFEQFSLGKLFRQDTSFIVTGDLKTKFLMDQPHIQAYLEGNNITIETESLHHSMDSMNLELESEPFASSIKFYTDNIFAISETNFDIREVPELFDVLLKDYIIPDDSLRNPKGSRNVKFDLSIENPTLFQLFDLDIKDFNEISIGAEFDENDHLLEISAGAKAFNGFGLSFDTMDLKLIAFIDSLNSNIYVNHLYYDSIQLGNLELDVFNSGNTAFSNLRLTRDSVSLADISSRLTKPEEDFNLFLDSLVAFDLTYNVNPDNPIIINNDNITFNQFQIDRSEMELSLDGNLDQFDLNVQNVDLRRLNDIFANNAINSGTLTSSFSYSKPNERINLDLNVDSLTIYEYPPMYIVGKANNMDSTIPFQFNLNSTTNNIDLGGNYNFDNSLIDGSLSMDINDLEIFKILVPQYLNDLGGKIKGEAAISGNVNQPKLDGSFRLLDIRLITANPKAIIEVKDERIDLDNTGITFDDFTLYDQINNPLTVNGFVKTEDYRSFNYDLNLNTDKYILINNPIAKENQLQGILILGGHVNMAGDNNNTFISADLIVKDSTDLSYLTASEDIELISGEGIVEFIDPQSADSIYSINTQFYYDSLIANLPKFELKSTIKLEEKALLRLIIDPRSGDFIEARGTADIQIGLDRTGNIQLSGNYAITEGLYQLSFYDIVKKAFIITPGSNVVWEGDPKTGILNLSALNTIKTSSTGLIGHEVGENERAIYRRALPYEVRINISGFLDNPKISFGLDLPQEEKINYPALANKLNRLKQPEYESELNKQVFGLLVLGGFIPESSGSDFNQNLVATTAISNSVNSILASQLNRFAGKFVKGFDIDVGLQSYSDYSTGSGKTRTAMDVRVTKRMFDDRLSFEIGGGMDLTTDQSGPNTGSDNFRGDVAIIYDLTESGNKQLKAFNNETYDIIYQQVRNTGISLIFIKEFDKSGNEKK